MPKLLAPAGFIGTILIANAVTSAYGMVPVAPGVVATAGTYAAGLSFVLRDLVHDLYGRRATLALIVLGAALSFAISAPFIALASGVAFLLSESADLLVYAPLRRRGYIRAAVASNIVGSIVDTLVFLSIAGFPLVAFGGQMIGKLTVTAVTVGLVFLARKALPARRFA